MGRTETGGAAVTTDAPACLLCGRPLRDEESRRRQFGPRCFKRLQRLVAPRPRNSRTPRTSRVTADQLALDLNEPDEEEDPDEDEWADGYGYRPPPRDLWGQGLTARQTYTMTDVPLTGSYL